jgi:hypothetical protein
MNRRTDQHTFLYIEAVIMGLPATGVRLGALALCEYQIPIEIALRVLTRPRERRGNGREERRRLPRIEPRTLADPARRRQMLRQHAIVLEHTLACTPCGQIFLNGQRQHKRIANEKP